MARHPKFHHRKLPFLVDAKVVVGAGVEGRSSARALRTVLRSAAAHTMAANVLPRIVYIPSESNPADAPSRGERAAPSTRPKFRSQTTRSRSSKVDCRLRRLQEDASWVTEWLSQHGLLGQSSSESSSGASASDHLPPGVGLENDDDFELQLMYDMFFTPGLCRVRGTRRKRGRN